MHGLRDALDGALRAPRSLQDVEDEMVIYQQAWAEGRELTDEEREQVKRIMNLTAKASFPEDLAGELTVLVSYQNEAGDEQYLGGARYADGDIVPVNKNGQEPTSSESEDIGDAQSPAYDGHGFVLQKVGESKTMLFEADLDAEGGRLVATVRYVPIVGVFPQEDYVMELSR